MTDYQTDKKRREVQIRTQVSQKLEESGERDKLKELLRGRLRECGWRDQLKDHCRGIITQKGLSNVTVDGLIQEITPKARASVPDAVKKELLTRIREYLEKQT
ncbi:transcription and mRNA export factor ENY2-like isoform X2 [Halichondria panicea]|uniref:transcription and mRNA export factor ENY2-like isoform X2 n=1 Tax=Halichondria panicea TaxID=6063 RepID=UPI00312B75E1